MILTLAAVILLRAEWNPPVKYDYPYRGELMITQLEPYKIQSACNKLFKEHNLIPVKAKNGCAVRYNNGKSCDIIIINRNANGTTPKAVFRHENGHCNGWPGDHPEK